RSVAGRRDAWPLVPTRPAAGTHRATDPGADVSTLSSRTLDELAAPRRRAPPDPCLGPGGSRAPPRLGRGGAGEPAQPRPPSLDGRPARQRHTRAPVARGTPDAPPTGADADHLRPPHVDQGRPRP